MNPILGHLFLLVSLISAESAFPFETAGTRYQQRNLDDFPKDHHETSSGNYNNRDDSTSSANTTTTKFYKQIDGVFTGFYKIPKVNGTIVMANYTADYQQELKANISKLSALTRMRRDDNDDDKPADSGDDADAQNDPENPDNQDTNGGGPDPNDNEPNPDYPNT